MTFVATTKKFPVLYFKEISSVFILLLSNNTTDLVTEHETQYRPKTHLALCLTFHAFPLLTNSSAFISVFSIYVK